MQLPVFGYLTEQHKTQALLLIQNSTVYRYHSRPSRSEALSLVEAQ
jgi:hypothetical protein